MYVYTYIYIYIYVYMYIVFSLLYISYVSCLASVQLTSAAGLVRLTAILSHSEVHAMYHATYSAACSIHVTHAISVPRCAARRTARQLDATRHKILSHRVGSLHHSSYIASYIVASQHIAPCHVASYNTMSSASYHIASNFLASCLTVSPVHDMHRVKRKDIKYESLTGELGMH